MHLQQRDQDHGLHGLEDFVREIAQDGIIRHRDRDVKTFAACCLVDILRLSAPDAPYDPEKLNVCGDG
jgi:sister-chromatid-cohesion protein PDS5